MESGNKAQLEQLSTLPDGIKRVFIPKTKCSSVPKQSIQRLEKIYLCAPSIDVQSIEEGSSGSSGKHLEATLGVLDPTDTEDIDQKVKPVHQKVAEE